jgi:glycosyltransferase involved in cell wall biosynthesis
VTPLSALLITKDEEARLPAALASLAFCDEIVVLDCGSGDRTREVAERAGARVSVNAPFPGFVAQRNLALERASHDWVLCLDADERVTDALRDEIQALRRAGFPAVGYRMPRVSFYLGRWIRATDWYPDLQLRLFDRRRGRWQGGHVHESVAVEGRVAVLRHEIEHHPYVDIADHMRRIDLYTTLWARHAFESGRRTGGFEMAGAAGWAFLRNYLFRGGLRLGLAGLTISMLNAYYTFAKLAKLSEQLRQAGAAR